jgi:hypothetical protein
MKTMYGWRQTGNQLDIAKVKEWLRHANISTARLYDWRKTKPEDSPTFHEVLMYHFGRP